MSNTIKIIGIFTSGLIVGVLLVGAFYYHSERRDESVYNNAIDYSINLSSFKATKTKEQILDTDFERSINDTIKKDSQFAVTRIAMNEIPDAAFEAYRRIFYNAALDMQAMYRTNSVLTPSKPISRFDKNSWVWISKSELRDYVAMLETASTKFHKNFNGARIYFGMVDSNYFSKEFVNSHRSQLDKQQGAIFPMFVATETDGNDDSQSYDSELLRRYDCNCGNPPGFCTENQRVCNDRNKCKQCLIDNPSQGVQE